MDKDYYERWGLFATLQSALLYRLRIWFGLRVYGIFIRTLSEVKRPGIALPPGFTYRIFSQGDAGELIARATRPDLELAPAFVGEALDRGDLCTAILHDGAVVSYGWSAFGPTHDSDGVFVDFREHYRYGYKAFTLAQYRGLHLPRSVGYLSDRHFLDRCGCTHSISFIAVGNRASVRHAIAKGSVRVGFAGYLKRGRVFLPFRTPGVRRHGFRFYMPNEARHADPIR